MIKSTLLSFSLLSLLVLSGCGIKNQELELLREQNALLQQQLENVNAIEDIDTDILDQGPSNGDSEKSIPVPETVKKPVVTSSNDYQPSISVKEDDFYKRQDCSKYQSSIENDHPYGLVIIFFSPVKNTCVAKVVYMSPRSGGMIYDILGNDFYAVIGLDGVMVYDESEFGPNQTLVGIESQLK